MGRGLVNAESLSGDLRCPGRTALRIFTVLPMRNSVISSIADLVSIRDISDKLNRMILFDRENELAMNAYEPGQPQISLRKQEGYRDYRNWSG